MTRLYHCYLEMYGEGLENNKSLNFFVNNRYGDLILSFKFCFVVTYLLMSKLVSHQF